MIPFGAFVVLYLSLVCYDLHAFDLAPMICLSVCHPVVALMVVLSAGKSMQ